MEWALSAMIIKRIPHLFLLFLLLATLAASGCKSRKHAMPKEPAAAKTPELKIDFDDDSGPDDIKVYNADGAAVLKFKEKSYGFKLYTLNEAAPPHPIARLKLEGS